MKEMNDIVSFMDILDFDEELVDSRLRGIMERKSFTNGHLSNIISLLNYKFLLNIKESDECENDIEFEFVVRLIGNINESNIEETSKIVNIILSLNPSSITVKSEHLLQQLLFNVSDHLNDTNSEEGQCTLLLMLKLCDSILEAVVSNGKKLTLPFLDIPLERILLHHNENLKNHFLSITVKRFFDGIDKYNILDRIWDFIKQLENNKLLSLRVLCILSNYFLPLPDEHGTFQYKSNVVSQTEFWDLALYGLSCDDSTTRKLATYLIKRAIDCLVIEQLSIDIQTDLFSFKWVPGKATETKRMWDNFFILIDSLEEKQSNIVLPSLQLFDSLQDLGQSWLNCAYNIGLQHDNLQVKVQCANYRLQYPTRNDKEAIVLLEALNDMNIYDVQKDFVTLLHKLKNHLNDTNSFVNIIRNISRVKWSPVPIYHLSTVLASLDNVGLVNKINEQCISTLLSDLLKVQCNNIIIRKAFHRNLSHLIGNCCLMLDWRELLNIYNQLEDDLWKNENDNPFIVLIRNKLNVIDKARFFTDILESYKNVDFTMLYLSGHQEDFTILLQLFTDTLNSIELEGKNINCNQLDCLRKVIFILDMSTKMESRDMHWSPILSLLKEHSKKLMNYVYTILNNNYEDTDNKVLFFDYVRYIIKLNIDDINLQEMYDQTITVLEDGNNIYKNIFSISIFNTINSMTINDKLIVVRISNINSLIKIQNSFPAIKDCKIEGYGRLKNILNCKACEALYILLGNKTDEKIHYSGIVDYIDTAIECGGYSCLKWILSIVDVVLTEILDIDTIKFDLSNFLHRIWNEIEAIKTNKLYAECIECFVKVILNDALLKKPIYNNVVITYCTRIVDYASVKNNALYYLIDSMEKKDVLQYGHMVYVFTELLLATAVPRKDQRITENLIVNLSKIYDFQHVQSCLYTNFHIKHKSLLVLSKITDNDTLETMVTLIIKKLDDLFKNKQRYHSNSILHRTLRAGLQHLLFIFLKHRSQYTESVAMWCIEFLGKLPHQSSIRICLEWYISLYYYYKGEFITDKLLQYLRSKNVPIVSQFMILNWLVLHKIDRGNCQKSEFELVMDMFMENTMGPTYSVRLYAQYLAKLLHDRSKYIDTCIYDKTISVIDKTLTEASKLNEKSFIKLTKDYFVHQFDIIKDLTPCFIYHFILTNDELNNEAINDSHSLEVYEKMMDFDSNDDFFKEWKETRSNQTISMSICDSVISNSELMDGIKDADIGNIQKKYVPWKQMSDIDVLDMKQGKSKSELIVVASLIDKLPNLGGMARTSEVFGVHTYVIDSVRHLQDKQFQGLSVSAERWVNVIEVRPGQPLKDYLTAKKAEGYTIVAAEQTSASVSLQSFKFPKKTLLLLGHEKEGVPCDLLPFMDSCVEIPQQGFVRSLNVHVTAAIFIWEYSRQILLYK